MKDLKKILVLVVLGMGLMAGLVEAVDFYPVRYKIISPSWIQNQLSNGVNVPGSYMTIQADSEPR